MIFDRFDTYNFLSDIMNLLNIRIETNYFFLIESIKIN